jgi:hypothetical protein
MARVAEGERAFYDVLSNRELSDDELLMLANQPVPINALYFAEREPHSDGTLTRQGAA